MYYEQGFIDKCAEYGFTQAEAIKLANLNMNFNTGNNAPSINTVGGGPNVGIAGGSANVGTPNNVQGLHPMFNNIGPDQTQQNGEAVQQKLPGTQNQQAALPSPQNQQGQSPVQ